MLRPLRCFVTAAALAAIACTHTPEAPARPAVPHTLHEFSLNDGTLHVELRIPEAPPGRKPVLLSPFSDPDALLERGVIVATYQVDWQRIGTLLEAAGAKPPQAPEAPADTEERVGSWLLSSPRPGIVGRSYFQLIGADANQTVPAVLDLLETLPEVDPQRIAIAGSSTQGFVALQALKHDPRLAGAVVRVACGDYFTFLRSSLLALGNDPRWVQGKQIPLDTDYAQELRQQQPISSPDAYPPRPLLVLAGREDPIMPLECVEHTDQVFASAYARAGVPQRFRTEILPGAGHDLGSQSDALVLGWLEQWLIPAPAAPAAAPASSGS